VATVTDQSSYWEKAQQEGFDLSWLKQLEENVIGDSVADVSDNLTGRVEGSNPRQWSSATDIPWETLEELPDDIEAAECQLTRSGYRLIVRGIPMGHIFGETRLIWEIPGKTVSGSDVNPTHIGLTRHGTRMSVSEVSIRGSVEK